MSKFLVESLQNLESYTPGTQPKDRTLIKLNTNENPFPPPPSLEKIAAEKSKNLHLYSDPTCGDLVRVFADYHKISENNVIFANGSDEILAFSFLAFCDKKKGVCFPEISYGFYEVFSELFQVPFEKIPLNEDLSINPSSYFQKNKTILIANPNAPTSLLLSLTDIEEILKQNPENVVLIDEAYIHFGGESALSLTEKYDNLLISGTFSKSRNLAGARLGYAMGNADLIADLNKIKYSFNPYNVNTLTQNLGVASLEDDEYFQNCCKNIIKTREYFTKELKSLGFTVLDSKANFVFTKHETLSGDALFSGLNDRNILVRHFSNPKICDFVRITIGTQKNMEHVIQNLKEMVEH